jgi:hypothetical protein
MHTAILCLASGTLTSSCWVQSCCTDAAAGAAGAGAAATATTAESAARSAVKLEEMTRLLERLAMDKVSEGDDAGARQVLQVRSRLQIVACRTLVARCA